MTLFGFGENNPASPRYGRVDVPETNDHFVQINLTAGPGWSGSPITNERGYVLGVAVGGDPSAALGLPLFRVKSLLINRNVLQSTNAEEAMLSANEEFASCPDNSAKILGYEHTEVLPGVKFGPVDGGFNRAAACNANISALISKYPPGSVFTGSNYRENSFEQGIRRFKYEYWCDIKIEWGPIFEQTRHQACGQRDLRTDPLRCITE
jgi:hypothetical protein